MKMHTALTIAGSDSSGGAGIQADLKTMCMNGVFGMSAITALTAQNTTGVSAISEVSPAFLAEQIDMVFADIRPDAVKIGMVSAVPLIEVIAERLAFWHAENVVVDPVMVATSGARLIAEDAVDALTARLFPLACVVTPNIPEAELLSGLSITDVCENPAALLRRDGDAVRHDLVHGVPLRPVQVRPRGDYLKLQGRVVLYVLHQPLKVAVFGPRGGDDADFLHVYIILLARKLCLLQNRLTVFIEYDLRFVIEQV